MDRGAWRATVHGLARVGHGLGTKPPRSTLRNGSNRRKTGSEWVGIDSRRDGCGQQPGPERTGLGGTRTGVEVRGVAEEGRDRVSAGFSQVAE